MTERGMIFNAEMVRAILDGRKTQTRRIMKPQPTPDDYVCPYNGPRGGHIWPSKNHQYGLHVEGMLQNGEGGWEGLASDACHFGEIGDRIWVRETWAEAGAGAPDLKLYRANYPAHVPSHYENVPPAEDVRWTPSIHMPRWATRITLEITGVRVERLNSISQADAIAEGAPPSHPSIDVVSRQFGYPDFSRSWFGQTWQSIYGDDSWQANPWVWVIEFRHIEGDDHATD
ncbi:TPA: hypothetical protein OCE33_004260 [Escherichia coli]|nr:hypothetical protein [Escherichia coli]HCO6673699.1 hypothetical protein [Escherichia coli]HCO6811156.1 hypothetical protein [Escherichia coli]HCO9452781.1 hypothetical protein [Escherichia coli]HCO9966732.1 hypothetical protein [Escherichia coli]